MFKINSKSLTDSNKPQSQFTQLSKRSLKSHKFLKRLLKESSLCHKLLKSWNTFTKFVKLNLSDVPSLPMFKFNKPDTENFTPTPSNKLKFFLLNWENSELNNLNSKSSLISLKDSSSTSINSLPFKELLEFQLKRLLRRKLTELSLSQLKIPKLSRTNLLCQSWLKNLFFKLKISRNKIHQFNLILMMMFFWSSSLSSMINKTWEFQLHSLKT